MPFRTAQEPGSHDAPPRRAPPELVAFAVADDAYRVVLREGMTARAVRVARAGGAARDIASAPLDPAECAGRWHGAAWREAWAVFAGREAVAAWGHGCEAPFVLCSAARVAPRAGIAALVHDGAPCVAVAGGGDDPRRGPRIRVMTAAGEDLSPGWHAESSSRELLAATATVYGPAAIFSTDRADEIDVAVSGRGGEPLARTVSLGRGQSFECAQGGGTRILVVSRGLDGVTARTLASDVRSELNPAPVRPRTGWSVGRVLCAYANGPFVLAHAEHAGEETAAVVTVFDGAAARSSTRLALPGVHALGIEGKDLAVAALAAGASGPLLIVQRMNVDGGNRRRYAYLLGAPDCAGPEGRRALLADVAEALALSLGARAAAGLALRAHDERSDVATFSVPGPDAARDVSVAVLARADGGGLVTVRVGGGGAAPEPRGLNFVERVRAAVTGDDDANPLTTRIEVPSLAAGLESMISAIGALRAVS